MTIHISPPKLRWHNGEPYNEEYGDIYFSRDDGLEESAKVFLDNSGFPDRWRWRQQFVIAETGFGSSLNFLLTAKKWLESTSDNAVLSYISVEKHPLSVSDLRSAIAHWPALSDCADELLAVYPPVIAGAHQCELFNGRIRLLLLFGDATEMFSRLQLTVDAWYLDGFAPSKNPEMWSDSLFAQITRLSKKGTTAVSFTVAGIVKRGLKLRGFDIKKLPGFGGKRENLLAILNHDNKSKTSAPWFALPQNFTKKKNVIVIGAGIAGVTTAYLLAKNGHDVRLLEKESDIALGASGNPAGLVLPRLGAVYDSQAEFYLHAFTHTVKWLDELKQTDNSIPWYKTGVTLVVDNENLNKIRDIEQYNALLTESGDITSSDCKQAAVLLGNAGWLRPKEFSQRLLALAGENLVLKTDCNVTSIYRSEQSWSVEINNVECLNADAVVVCNAIWATELEPTSWLHVQSNKGQIAHFKTSKKSSRPISGKGYSIPEGDGWQTVGATYDVVDKNEGVNPKKRKELLTILESLGQNETDTSNWQERASFRTNSRDHLPIVGLLMDKLEFLKHFDGLRSGKTARYFSEAEYQDGLYVNIAHGSRGLTTAFYTSLFLADYISGKPNFLPKEFIYLLHPARFLVRDLRKKSNKT